MRKLLLQLLSGFFIAVPVLLTLAIFVVMMTMSARELEMWLRLKDSAVPVDAQITQVREIADDEDADGKDYELRVTYIAGGIRRRNVYWKRVERMEPDGFHGRQLTLYVDPEDPVAIRPEGGNAWLGSGMTVAVLSLGTYLAVMVAADFLKGRMIRKDWPQLYMDRVLDLQTIQQDLDHEEMYGRRYAVRLLLADACVLLLTVAFMHRERYVWVYAGLMGSILLLSSLLSMLHLLLCARRCVVTEIVETRCIAVQMDSDGDPVSWEMEGIGKQRLSRQRYVLPDGTEGAEINREERLHAALNQKRRVLRLYQADSFRVR